MWTAPTTRATGDLITASIWNTDLGDNLVYLHGVKKTTSKTVSNTTTETDLLNGEITVAANQLGTTGGLRLDAWGQWKQNRGANDTTGPQFKLKLGGTTIFDTGAGSFSVPNSSGTYPWRVEAEILNVGSASSQEARIDGYIVMGQTALANGGASFFTTGNGVYATQAVDGTNYGSAAFRGSLTGIAVDTTASAALELTVILQIANANELMTLRAATVRYI